ncbi:hypothetical protein [Tateyamaria pelophila]|uniref:hypothetical protein n=1 Tax=Tateyamaria pelophila TaxID=328415 RepID=UPI001CBC49D9|nr:hypothetical protein [Tateyamaria pelophila]
MIEIGPTEHGMTFVRTITGTEMHLPAAVVEKLKGREAELFALVEAWQDFTETEETNIPPTLGAVLSLVSGRDEVLEGKREHMGDMADAKYAKEGTVQDVVNAIMQAQSETGRVYTSKSQAAYKLRKRVNEILVEWGKNPRTEDQIRKHIPNSIKK